MKDIYCMVVYLTIWEATNEWLHWVFFFDCTEAT